jgi:hypothetical protein
MTQEVKGGMTLCQAGHTCLNRKAIRKEIKYLL